VSAEKKSSEKGKPEQAETTPPAKKASASKPAKDLQALRSVAAKKASMRTLSVEKVTLNMGTGKEQPRMEKAVKLLTMLTGRTPIKTITQKRIPTWGVRPGLPIGVKITLRREAAVEVLKRILEAKENRIKESSFGIYGELSFGIHEYIDIPGMKYDPGIGVMGFDICVTLQRAGFRIKRRRQMARKIPARHRISKEEAMAYMKTQFNIEVES